MKIVKGMICLSLSAFSVSSFGITTNIISLQKQADEQNKKLAKPDDTNKSNQTLTQKTPKPPIAPEPKPEVYSNLPANLNQIEAINSQANPADDQLQLEQISPTESNSESEELALPLEVQKKIDDEVEIQIKISIHPWEEFLKFLDCETDPFIRLIEFKKTVLRTSLFDDSSKRFLSTLVALNKIYIRSEMQKRTFDGNQGQTNMSLSEVNKCNLLNENKDLIAAREYQKQQREKMETNLESKIPKISVKDNSNLLILNSWYELKKGDSLEPIKSNIISTCQMMIKEGEVNSESRATLRGNVENFIIEFSKRLPTFANEIIQLGTEKIYSIADKQINDKIKEIEKLKASKSESTNQAPSQINPLQEQIEPLQSPEENPLSQTSAPSTQEIQSSNQENPQPPLQPSVDAEVKK